MTQQTLTRFGDTWETDWLADAVQNNWNRQVPYEGLPFIERLSLLVEHEQPSREQRKQARLVNRRGLKLQATVQEVDYQSATQPGAVTGGKPGPRRVAAPGPEPAHYRPCGCGKTYLACALGCQACQQGHSTRYYRLPRLLLEAEPGQR